MRRLAFLIIAAVLVFCTGCVSPRSEFPDPIDYTDGGAVIHEMMQIRNFMAEKPLEALVRAKRLTLYTENTQEITALYQEAESNVEALFEETVKAEQWADAIRIFRSLTVLKAPPAQCSEEKLLTAQRNAWKDKGYINLLHTQTEKQPAHELPPSIQTVRNMIQGTVTVWVDRGITIEKGLGRADRMIGSGFFIDNKGHVITNYHVIQSEVDPKYEGYSRVYIKMPDNTAVRIPAKVIGWDPVFDLALLKTEITPPVYFSLGSSDDLNVGSKIYAIGSPAGLEQTLTSGIVSAQNRRFLSLGSVLQIDAPVNHGSSGGPIIDEAGRVQAIVFAGLERQEGLNFAIPVELLKSILPQLYAGGKIGHAWMGAYGQTSKEEIAPQKGAELVYTLPAGPASQIPAGTVITEINGVRTANLEALQAELMRFTADTIIRVSGYEPAPEGTEGDTALPETRQKKDWFVLLENRPENPAEQVYKRDRPSRAVLPLYGITLENAGWKKSFRITGVLQGSYADEAGFTVGDYFELRSMELDSEYEIVRTRIYTQRRKAAFVDSFMEIGAYLDSPSYF